MRPSLSIVAQTGVICECAAVTVPIACEQSRSCSRDDDHRGNHDIDGRRRICARRTRVIPLWWESSPPICFRSQREGKGKCRRRVARPRKLQPTAGRRVRGFLTILTPWLRGVGGLAGVASIPIPRLPFGRSPRKGGACPHVAQELFQGKAGKMRRSHAPGQLPRSQIGASDEFESSRPRKINRYGAGDGRCDCRELDERDHQRLILLQRRHRCDQFAHGLQLV